MRGFLRDCFNLWLTAVMFFSVMAPPTAVVVTLARRVFAWCLR